jgi:hypothetical protein
MHCQSPHHDKTLFVRNIRSLANCQNHQTHRPSGSSQLPPAKSPSSVPVGERDSTEGESSLPCTICDQNSTLSSSLNNSRVADLNQCVTATLSVTQRRSMNTPTATPDTSHRSTTACGGTSMQRIVSCLASGIVITPTPHQGLENLPATIPNPEARSIITNPL